MINADDQTGCEFICHEDEMCPAGETCDLGTNRCLMPSICWAEYTDYSPATSLSDNSDWATWYNMVRLEATFSPLSLLGQTFDAIWHRPRPAARASTVLSATSRAAWQMRMQRQHRASASADRESALLLAPALRPTPPFLAARMGSHPSARKPTEHATLCLETMRPPSRPDACA